MDQNSLKRLYADIRDSVRESYRAFLASGQDEQSGYLRSPEKAEQVLQAMEFICLKLQQAKLNFPDILSLFEKEYAPVGDLQNREVIIETIFLEDYLFPESEMMAFVYEQQYQEDLLEDHKKAFSDWCEVKTQLHRKAQNWIRNSFSYEIKIADLDCQCTQCVADYRAKFRDQFFNEQIKKISEVEEKLYEDIVERKIDQIAKSVFDLRKDIDKALHSIRFRLKRASLNKLDADIKDRFKEKFSPQSSLAKVYKEKIRVYLNSVLVDMDLKPELLSEDEFERFYSQLGVNLWKPTKFIKREFQRTVQALLSFKRKDISATILREYLGHFWTHSEARKIQRKVIYHMGPTNSGKTYHAIQALCQASKGSYLAPLRLLASELYDTMNEKGVKTTLLTGEEVIELEGATHYSSTIEMAKLHEAFDTVVIDEIQMITDPQRGWAWTRALVNIVAREVHICGDHSALDLVQKILELTGDTLEVKNYERMTELKVEGRSITLEELKRGDALIVFSRRNALKFKSLLEGHGLKVSIVYGRLSPEVRREQARKFDEGETDIMVSTDAIAMGMNLPVRRIVFSALSKFINSKEYPLSDSEIKQISGRAGRYQRFPTGYVTCLDKVDGGKERLNQALNTSLKQKTNAMVGPDLEIFHSVNEALEQNGLTKLNLTEFLRLFNTMSFEKPFYCVDLREMIEVAEMVEQADFNNVLSSAESFGFACAPVNLGLIEHVQFYVWILNHYVRSQDIVNEEIDVNSKSIDYLEAAIKCVELYQWLARHFENKNFVFDAHALTENKTQAIEQLNELLSDKTDFDDFQFPRRRGRGPRNRNDNRGSKKTRRSNQSTRGEKRNNDSKKFSRKKTSKGSSRKKKSNSYKKYR